MRRGWIVAGALILAAVPSVPVAAVGVSLVLERVNTAGGVGKWVRTGDMQRFRVRLNGMAEGARVAVAASPVEALTEVACVTSPVAQGAPAVGSAAGASTGGAPAAGVLGSAPGSTGTGEAFGHGEAFGPGGVSGTGEVSGTGKASGMGKASGRAGAVAAGEPAVRALVAVEAPVRTPVGGSVAGSAGGSAGASASAGTVVLGARVCRLGKVSGERAVDVTLKAPPGAREVVLAAVARTRDAGGGAPTTMSRTATLRVREAIRGDEARFSGHAHRLRPEKRNGAGVETASDGVASGGVVSDGVASDGVVSGGAASGGVVPSQALPRRARRDTPSRTSDAAMNPAVSAVPQTPGVAVPRRSGVVPQRAGALVLPPASGTASGVAPQVLPTTAGAIGGRPGAVGGQSGAVEGPGTAGGEPGTPGGSPGVVGGQPGAVTGQAGTAGDQLGGVSVQASPLVTFQPDAAAGEAPLPWEVAVSAKPLERVGWASPIDGPKALPYVAGCIAALLAALWCVVTVQRGRIRRKVL